MPDRIKTPTYPDVYIAAINNDFHNLQIFIEERRHSIKALRGVVEYNLFHFAILNDIILQYLTDPKTKLYKRFKDGTTDMHAHVVASRFEEFEKYLKPIKTLKASGEQALQSNNGVEDAAILNMRRDLVKLEDDYIKILLEQNERGEGVFYWAGCVGNFDFIKTLWDSLPEKVDRETRVSMLNDCISGASFKADAAKKYKLFELAIELHENIQACLIKLEALAPEDDYKDSIEECNDAIKTLTVLNEESEKQKIIYDKLFKEAMALKQALADSTAQWGFDCYEIERDGDCLFSAILHQLENHPDGAKLLTSIGGYNKVLSLRKIAVNHLRNHRNDYSFFVDMDFDQYLQSLLCKGVWADQLVIFALVRELNLSLVIISIRDDQLNIFKAKESSLTLYLGHEPESHYQSLIINPNLIQQKFIEEKFVAAGYIEQLAPPADAIEEVECEDVKYEINIDMVMDSNDSESVVKKALVLIDNYAGQSCESLEFKSDDEIDMSDLEDEMDEGMNPRCALVGSDPNDSFSSASTIIMSTVLSKRHENSPNPYSLFNKAKDDLYLVQNDASVVTTHGLLRRSRSLSR